MTVPSTNTRHLQVRMACLSDMTLKTDAPRRGRHWHAKEPSLLWFWALGLCYRYFTYNWWCLNTSKKKSLLVMVSWSMFLYYDVAITPSLPDVLYCTKGDFTFCRRSIARFYHQIPIKIANISACKILSRSVTWTFSTHLFPKIRKIYELKHTPH